MAQKVGEIYYDVTLDTSKLIDGERQAKESMKDLGKGFDTLDKSTKDSAKSMDAAGDAANKAAGRFRDASGRLREANGQFVRLNETTHASKVGLVEMVVGAEVLEGKLHAVALAVKLLAVAYATLKSAQLADDMRMLAARVEVAAGSIDKGAEAMRQLEAISRRTQTAISDNAAVFSRLNQSMIQMGGTQGDTLKLVELLGKAVKVSGASAVEASAAMLQFGQALGSGKLAGDELRSLMETAPYLMRQLADGIGVPVGALKKLGEEGKLTSDVVVNALSKAATQIDADFAKFPQTIGAAMTVATDAALKANEKLDELTGTSAALTGVTQGLGRVLDKLALQFGAANTEAGKMGRNDAIASWAQKTQTAFSYVVDAADVTWQALSVFGRNVNFVFTAIGTEIGGIGAQIAAVMRGDFAGAKSIGDAMTADAQARRAELDKQDAETLARRKTWGAQMREAWAVGAGGGRGFVNPQAAGGKIKPPSGADDGKAKKQPFDASKYLAGLSAKAADEWAKVAIVEAEALRQNDALLKKKDITQKQHEEAKTLIIADANKQRTELMAKDTEAYLKEMSDRYQREQMLKEKAEKGQNAAKLAISEAKDDPVERIRNEEQRKLDAMEEFRMRDVANSQLYEDAKLAIKKDAAKQEQAIQDQNNMASLTMAGNLASSMYDLLVKSGKEKSALGKALFLASKAMAVAEIIMNTEVAAAKAGAQLGIFGLPMATMIRATGYASAGMVAGMAVAEVSGGRQYGGPVSSGSLYRVNEQGRPEMFTAANGAQYMMPTTGGRVTSADNVGGGVQWSIVVNNTAPGATATASVDQNSRTISIAVSEVANQIRTNTGPVWSALKSSTTTGSRL